MVGVIGLSLTGDAVGTTVLASTQTTSAGEAPSTAPAQTCDSASLNGPSQQPVGSVRIEPGTNLSTATQANGAATTFWLAPGIHRLGSNPSDQVIPLADNVYVGAPGAVLDGQNVNVAAFTGGEPGIKIRYLTVQNFVAPDDQAVVNQGGGKSWTIEYTTIRNNRGAGILLGDNNVLRHSCLTRNDQYAVMAYTRSGTQDITIDHNELAYNAAGNYPTSCGCAGATKFFEVRGATITANWVHHNSGPGLWADTNAVGFLIEGNYINDNQNEGIFYEASYNAYIHNNTLKRNALVKGRVFADRNDPFPVGAIYISESGGDARVSDRYATLEISGNVLEDNWGGVILWEDPNRFCNTASPATGYCPLPGSASLANCVPGTIGLEPYRSDCRWKTQNVWVHHNDFRIDKTALGCAGTRCGQHGLFSLPGSTPDWSPYKGPVVPNAITFNQNNRFSDNTYNSYEWQFTVYEIGRVVDFAGWQGAPYYQDTGSTTPRPLVQTNALDADSAGLEGSLGRWAPWYAVSISQSSMAAHTGSRSLQVALTGSDGWGVTLNNWPGFATKAGGKTVSFWGRSAAGAGPSATLRVRWRNSSGSDLQTDLVTTAVLSTAWQQASATMTAPTDTAWVAFELLGSTGATGNTLYFDDFVVADGVTTTTTTTAVPTTTTVPTASSNALDSDTSTLGRSLGEWAPWYSTAVSRTTAEAHSGTGSLRVDVDSSNGWGVIANNWPGFATSAGTKTVSFWAKSAAAAGPIASLRLKWRDTAGSELHTDDVTTPALTTAWQQAADSLTAPAGTAWVGVELVGGTGAEGTTLYFDDFMVG